MSLELRHLRALVAVVDAGSFTEAAPVLGVSQAAVSRAIAGLEQVLGVRLLQRTTRHVALTPAGNRVVARARVILDDVDQLERSMTEAGRELRVGYAWSALGKHTTHLQRRWAAEHPDTPLVFVNSNTPTAGLVDGIADIAVVRRPVDSRRFESALVGVEARYAAMATGSSLARKRAVRLADLSRFTVAVDERTGTTTADLWPPGQAPKIRRSRGTDEWLTLIAARQAIGMSSEATANQNPRPGVAYRPVVDAEPIQVWLAWWRDDPPSLARELVALVRESYARGRR